MSSEATIEITKITPFFPRGVFVQWEVDDPEGIFDEDTRFDIERSESPCGPFQLLTIDCAVSGFVNYLDHSVPLHALDKWWYYRVRAEDSCSEAVTYNVRKGLLPIRQQGEIAKMQNDFLIKLRVDTGVEVYIFKRKHFGTKCNECYDSTTGIVTTTNCSTCFGTKYEGGYYNPIRTLVEFGAPPVQQSTDQEGETQTTFVDAKMLDFPLLIPDDLIYELDSGDVYEVKQTLHTKRRRITVHQELTLSLLHRSAPQYRLTIGERSLGIELEII